MFRLDRVDNLLRQFEIGRHFLFESQLFGYAEITGTILILVSRPTGRNTWAAFYRSSGIDPAGIGPVGRPQLYKG